MLEKMFTFDGLLFYGPIVLSVYIFRKLYKKGLLSAFRVFICYILSILLLFFLGNNSFLFNLNKYFCILEEHGIIAIEAQYYITLEQITIAALSSVISYCINWFFKGERRFLLDMILSVAFMPFAYINIFWAFMFGSC